MRTNYFKTISFLLCLLFVVQPMQGLFLLNSKSSNPVNSVSLNSNDSSTNSTSLNHNSKIQTTQSGPNSGIPRYEIGDYWTYNTTSIGLTSFLTSTNMSDIITFNGVQAYNFTSLYNYTYDYGVYNETFYLFTYNIYRASDLALLQSYFVEYFSEYNDTNPSLGVFSYVRETQNVNNPQSIYPLSIGKSWDFTLNTKISYYTKSNLLGNLTSSDSSYDSSTEIKGHINGWNNYTVKTGTYGVWNISVVNAVLNITTLQYFSPVVGQYIFENDTQLLGSYTELVDYKHAEAYNSGNFSSIGAIDVSWLSFQYSDRNGRNSLFLNDPFSSAAQVENWINSINSSDLPSLKSPYASLASSDFNNFGYVNAKVKVTNNNNNAVSGTLSISLNQNLGLLWTRITDLFPVNTSNFENLFFLQKVKDVFASLKTVVYKIPYQLQPGESKIYGSVFNIKYASVFVNDFSDSIKTLSQKLYGYQIDLPKIWWEFLSLTGEAVLTFNGEQKTVSTITSNAPNVDKIIQKFNYNFDYGSLDNYMSLGLGLEMLKNSNTNTSLANDTIPSILNPITDNAQLQIDPVINQNISSNQTISYNVTSNSNVNYFVVYYNNTSPSSNPTPPPSNITVVVTNNQTNTSYNGDTTTVTSNSTSNNTTNQRTTIGVTVNNTENITINNPTNTTYNVNITNNNVNDTQNINFVAVGVSKPKISVTPLAYDEGSHIQGTVTRIPLTISNFGSGNLTILSYGSDNPGISLSNKFPIKINPNSNILANLQIDTQYYQPGKYQINVSILSNDYNNRVINITITITVTANQSLTKDYKFASSPGFEGFGLFVTLMVIGISLKRKKKFN